MKEDKFFEQFKEKADEANINPSSFAWEKLESKLNIEKKKKSFAFHPYIKLTMAASLFGLISIFVLKNDTKQASVFSLEVIENVESSNLSMIRDFSYSNHSVLMKRVTEVGKSRRILVNTNGKFDVNHELKDSI